LFWRPTDKTGKVKEGTSNVALMGAAKISGLYVLGYNNGNDSHLAVYNYQEALSLIQPRVQVQGTYQDASTIIISGDFYAVSLDSLRKA
jgi:hypothetical protein